MNMNPSPAPYSPPWNSSTKLVVGASLVVVLGASLVRFRSMLGPLLLAVVFAYLIYPLAAFIDRHTPLSWRTTVNLLYLLLVTGLLWLLGWSSVTLVQQVNGLAGLVQNALPRLPSMLQDLLSRPLTFGPFAFDFSQIDAGTLVQQILAAAQTAIANVGVAVGALAGSALQVLGWLSFILLVSYFILLDSNGLRDSILRIEVPRYQHDLDRMRRELSYIWNAFLRGQVVLFFLSVLIYSIVLTVFGVRSAFLLALLAGLARFIPYLGPFAVWTTLGFVAFFQAYRFLEMSTWWYVGTVLGTSILIDQIFDNLISPRIMGRALRVHPAGVLVAALVGANLFGLIGVVLAAPMLATLKLVLQYIYRKMFDLPPWDGMEEHLPASWSSSIGLQGWQEIFKKIFKRRQKHEQQPGTQD